MQKWVSEFSPPSCQKYLSYLSGTTTPLPFPRHQAIQI